MSSPADHVLLTRFNLPSAGVESLIRAKEGWLRGRVALFERYTVPSVESQTLAQLRWLVYFDPESPQWLREWIQGFASREIFHPIFRETVSVDDLLSDAEGLGLRTRQDLITTNLDNDDGLADDFAQRLQAIETGGGRSALYLSRGLILSPKGLFLRRDRLNAFCSVREPWDGAVTCWSNWHNLLPNSMPAIQVDGRPGWLQVVHGSNVSNRVRGRRVNPDDYRADFGALLSAVDRPARSALVRDRLVDGPRRALYETTRSVGKRMIMTVGGKDAIGRVKDLLASHKRAERSMVS